jgi:cobalt-zinc-cadmium efflux system membrane fusion protein
MRILREKIAGRSIAPCRLAENYARFFEPFRNNAASLVAGMAGRPPTARKKFDMLRILPHSVRHMLPVATAIAAAAIAWWAVPDHPLQAVPQVAPDATPKPATGAFRPTKDQWAALKVAEVQALPFRSMLRADGNIAFNDDALTPVFSPYSGRVLRLHAKLGDVVKKGMPLMTVEAAEFVQGQSDVATAKANVELARATERRQHDLFDAGAAALKDWRQAQAELASAQAAHAAARGRLRILGKSDAEIDGLERGVTPSTAAVVTAPISGTVTQRQVGLGQYIASAATGAANPQFTIGDMTTVWLVANVREGDAPALRVGQPIEVRVLALPGRTFSAKIAWIGAAVDPVTHRLPVRAEVQNREGLLKPMMFASFSVATSETVQAPAVPHTAVVYEGEKTRVFVVSADGGIAVRNVEVGRHEGDMIEIVGGLRPGEKIVTAGTLFVDRAASGD